MPVQVGPVEPFMEIYHDQVNEVKWSSWLPALGYALGASTGPVLEIGIGHFSTPFLHEYCKSAGRGLWSVENDREWLKEFASRYDVGFHRLGSETGAIKSWGVVFIDSSPGGEARARFFRSYMNISDFIVVHDYWKDNEEAIKPYLLNIPFRVYNDYEPPTLLAGKITF